MSLSDKYKYFRNRCRELDVVDALTGVWAYDWAISNPDKKTPEWCEFHPAFHLKKSTLAREVFFGRHKLSAVTLEVLQFARGQCRKKRSIKKVSDAHRIFRAFNDFEDQQVFENLDRDSIHSQVHRIIQQQKYWQHAMTNTFDLPLYWNLYSRPDVEALLIKHFGLDFDEIYMLGTLFWLEFQKKPISAGAVVSDGLPQLNQKKIDNFCAAFSGDVELVRDKLRKIPLNLATHQYRFNPLLYYPMLNLEIEGQPRFLCPHPDFLFRRFTSGLFYDLVGKPKFSEHFGDAFNETMGNLLEGSISSDGPLVLQGEFAYGKKAETKNTPDWLISDKNCLVAIECKTKRPSQQYSAAERGIENLEGDFEALADAVVQVHKRILEKSEWGFSDVRNVLPIVCTLEDWIFIGTKLPEVLREKVDQKLKLEEQSDLLKKQIGSFGFILCKPHDVSHLAQIGNSLGLSRIIEAFQDKDKKGWLPETILSNLAESEGIEFDAVLKPDFDAHVARVLGKFR